MTKEKLIETTKNLLENISVLKNQLDCEVAKIEDSQKTKIERILKVIKYLSLDDQRLIQYKYFENRKQIEIAVALNIDIRTIGRRADRIALYIGRMIYGFEDEFMDMLDQVWPVLINGESEETEVELLNRAVAHTVNMIIKKYNKVIS
ncbi:hypothetical protein GKZ28_14625 [Clostridium chromiireducens]|uniref:Uncharacterized protein n=1 Tax=Clostridium chromiireducens TaxID=225345 RepID=A0A964W3B1_9CLOT|nr:sigma-70 family RNA polymerase sigma factor [Clostridium chromiireducens]MVX64927.1 hypothetical protein [Clostridium chromiireducens]